MKGILGKKVGMTRIFDERGEVVPVTVIEAGPCFVTQIKTEGQDGYRAIQLGFEEIVSADDYHEDRAARWRAQRKLTRGQLGHLGLLGTDDEHPRRRHLGSAVPPLRYLREFRVKEPSEFEEGQRITVEVFAVGDHVDVTGTSKGRGFAGVVKRHGFGGGPRTHGQSDRLRAPGSIGSTTTPGRVIKGMRMAGHMGHERVTVQNLEVVQVDSERNLLLVRGAVPGPKNGLLLIKEAIKQG
jgi:large subunit ribosomal protein L3